MSRSRYIVLEQGPDDSSTYPECWGSMRTSDGRIVGQTDDVREMVRMTMSLEHSNYYVRDCHTRRNLLPGQTIRRKNWWGEVETHTLDAAMRIVDYRYPR